MQIVDYKAVWQKIKAKRQQCGMTQEKLAEQCDISISFIAHIERGTKSLSLETAVRISSALNVSLDYLLLDEINDNARILDALGSELSKYPPEQNEKFMRLARLLVAHIEEI